MNAGTIPTELGVLSSMLFLNFEGNFLTGLAHRPLLHHCCRIVDDCVYNMFCLGTLPTELGQLLNLIGLSFTDNTFTGEL